LNNECLSAFDSIKKELTTPPVLGIYNPSYETELHSDASAIVIAGILLQKQPSKLWASISYYSQATNKAEINYHSFELEMLAIVKSIERFHIYLYGLEFTIITDCHALVYALNKIHLNPRIARWTLKLQNYSFKVKHREGRQMAHVDALSRIVAYIEALSLEKELLYRQMQDPKLKILAEKLSKTNDKEYELFDGLIYRRGTPSPPFVVPEEMVHNVIRCYDDEMAHCGYEKTLYGIAANYWFPSFKKKIKNYIDNCITCLVTNTSSNTRESNL